MNVIHLSTNLLGGAGIAAVRQHNALNQLGINSSFYFLRGEASDQSFVYKLKDRFSVLNRILFKLNIRKSYQKKINSIKNQIVTDFEFVSLPFSDFSLSKSNLVKDADIINLHWVSGLVDYYDLFANTNKPIVWTLHDMNPFYGIFHYSGDYDRSNNTVKRIDRDFFNYKLQCYQQAHSITFVAPSKWIKEQFEDSPLAKKYAIHYIPNSLDTHIFKYFDKKKAKNLLQWPIDKRIILFISDDINNPRKGFGLLHAALQNLPQNEYILVCVGKADPLQFDGIKNIIFTGSVYDEMKMNLIYAAADMFILPSMQDNLPNVMLESLSSGTPVVCFDSGGCVDYVLDEKNGIICKEKTPDSLVQGILRGFEIIGIMNSKLISADAIKQFNPSIQAEAYKNLYSKILGTSASV
jgi:glycosyltransferase involved in cell wall biosynthesis